MSNPKQVTTVRMTPAERAAVARLAEALDRTESAVISRLIPTGDWPAAILEAARLDSDPDALAMPAKLMAEGLRRLMERSAGGIKGSYLDALACPNEIARLFLEWSDGQSASLGLKGPLGNRYRLQETEHGNLPVLNEAYVPPPAVVRSATLEAVLEDLRSEDAARRLEGGFLLSRSLRIGGALEGSDPRAVALIAKAVSGEAGAVAELEAIVSARS